MDHPRKIAYRNGLFDPSNLTSPTKISSAVLEFGAVINRANYVEVLKDLFETRYVLVLVLSGIHEEIPLKEWLLDDFPSKPDNFEDSFAYKLLRKLSAFFLLYSSSADAETGSILKHHHKDVHHGTEVLKISMNMPFAEEQKDGRSPPPSPTRKKGKESQREQKQARKLARESLYIDHKPFATLGLTIPKNRDEADSICDTVWLKMGSILDVLLSGTRRPEVLNYIHTLFIPQERPEEFTVSAKPTITVQEPVSPPSPPIVAHKVPSLYPTVQSMRVAFYFDPPADFGRWRILLASRTDGDLRYWQRRDRKIFLIIMKKLKELSCGFFSNDNQKRLCGPNTDVPVFEAKMTGDLRLVYSVDCITDHDNKSEIQALRVFGIFTHSQMDYRLWECVSSFLSSHTKDYRKRCLARRQHPDGGNIYLPQSFSESLESSELEEPVDFNPSLPADDVNQLHHIISLEKFVILSKGLLQSIESNQVANFPFEVSKHERAIIEHPQSCYVLGRSGTGKTTTMLFKMLLIERAYQLSEELRERPRQIFVTKSLALVGKVEALFMSYFCSLAFTAHVDGPVAKTSVNVSNHTFNEDDDMEWGSDLPDKFSELEDRHFPLFITFNRLCSMIEADIEAAPSAECVDFSEESGVELFGKACSTERKGHLVTFDRFLAEYWPRLERHRFNALLIFNEINGVIAGSEGSLISRSGYLDREAYINLSSRMYPVFSEHRETTYGIFLSYLKRKRELDDYDFADRTHAIIRSMVKKSFSLRKVSHLYVDETQDQLLIDVFLLRLLCGNSHGLFWAGDTAQTISAGSSFRFNDLKAFLYRLQKAGLNQEASTPIRLKEPEMFYLSLNYRSHAGIVNCAHSIVEIINKYWKDSIDSLPPERGKAPGAMPIFYTDVYPEFVRKGHFLTRGGGLLQGKVELGAHQCILVRDDNAKEKLRMEVGHERFEKLGLVLTVYDSKGLEFNDVFLYNFFHDSLAHRAWRLVLNDAHNGVGGQIAVPQFDKTRHATLCAELKCLYVAITRARNNLRIADESLVGEPMRKLWEGRGQILSCKPGRETTDFARPSNDKEWADRGKLFFDNNQWEYAKHCYEKAGNQQMANVAYAYLQRERARRIPREGRGKERKATFRSAAEAFASCSQGTNDDTTKKKYLKLSAACLEEADCTREAAEVYRRGNWVSDASRLYRKLGMFDDVYDILTQSNERLAATIPQSIHDAARLYFVSKKAYGKAHELFDSVEEELDYLEDHSLHDAQLDLFERHGQQREAAELHLLEGRSLKAVDLYLQDTTDVMDSMSKAKGIILTSLWQSSPFGVTQVDRGHMNKLLERAARVKDAMDDNDIDEIMMFRAILNGAQTELSNLASTFLKRGNQHAALLCYDHYFERLPSLTDEDIQKITYDLHQFSEYVHTLRDFVFLDDPASNRTCQLFGFRTGEEKGRIVLLKPNTLCDSPYRHGMDLGSRGNLELTQEDFLTALQKCLEYRLKDRVTQETDICCRSQALQQPCLHHVILKKCMASPCDRSHTSADVVWFQHWIHAHLLQLVIYQSISGIQYPAQFSSHQRFWLVKLYEALNPASHDFGPTSNMVNAAIAAFPRAILGVLINWVRAVSFALEFDQEGFLTFAMMTADFAFAYDRREAESYMTRCKFVASSCPGKFSRISRVNSLQEMLMSWNQQDPSSVFRGILFICHVIDKQIPVNIHAFCSFIERICSLLIVCNFLQRKGSLHKIMLPRTWLKASLDRMDPEKAKLQIVSCFSALLQPLESLLHILCFPPAYGRNFQFKHGSDFRSLNAGGFMTRGPFIARICRVLGLLGSNIRVYSFRDQILNVFTSLRQETSHLELDSKFSRLVRGYFWAEHFGDVYLATRRSMRGAVFDEMVRLLHSEWLDTTHPERELRDQRDIVYSTHQELVILLDAIQDSVPLPSNAASLSHVEHDGLLGNAVDEDDYDQEIDVGSETAPDSRDLLPDTEIPDGVYIGHSEPDMKAATVIQRVWRRVLDRKLDLMKAGLESSARRWFEFYRKALLPDMVRGSRPPYSVYFLGTLPSLQAALDSIQTVLHKSKGSLKKKLGDNHEDLEEVGLNLTRVNKAMKNLKHHQRQLRPESDLHSKCNIDQLKEQVKKVFDVIDDIGPLVEMPNDLQEAFRIINSAVLQEHKQRIVGTSGPTVKQKHPQLMMEGLYELIQDVHEGI